MFLLQNHLSLQIKYGFISKVDLDFMYHLCLIIISFDYLEGQKGLHIWFNSIYWYFKEAFYIPKERKEDGC